MKFAEYGEENDEVILLLHGGGLAPWNYFEEVQLLKEKYHIIIPVLDGHNGSDRKFTTIEDNASEVIAYIDEELSGRVFLIGGLSLGGQILVEMLSQRKDICKFAIIESALVLPMHTIAKLIKQTFSLCYPFVKKHWFAKLQFESLHIKPSLFNDYFRDSAAITKENMITFLMANANYKIKSSLAECSAKTYVLVGSRESSIMKKSAKLISQQIPDSCMEVLSGFYHGDLSINHSELYVEKILKLIRKS